MVGHSRLCKSKCRPSDADPASEREVSTLTTGTSPSSLSHFAGSSGQKRRPSWPACGANSKALIYVVVEYRGIDISGIPNAQCAQCALWGGHIHGCVFVASALRWMQAVFEVIWAPHGRSSHSLFLFVLHVVVVDV